MNECWCYVIFYSEQHRVIFFNDGPCEIIYVCVELSPESKWNDRWSTAQVCHIGSCTV